MDIGVKACEQAADQRPPHRRLVIRRAPDEPGGQANTATGENEEHRVVLPNQATEVRHYVRIWGVGRHADELEQLLVCCKAAAGEPYCYEDYASCNSSRENAVTPMEYDRQWQQNK